MSASKGRATQVLAVAALVAVANAVPAQSNVDVAQRYSWGPNLGWIDWRGDGTNGAVFGERVASGHLYAANIGWINLGDGTPANGTAYANNSASDFGVNLDYTSNTSLVLLSGFAWSANAGWISFNVASTANRPRIDKTTGVLSGYAWGANIGWLPLDSTGSNVVINLPKGPPTDVWMMF